MRLRLLSTAVPFVLLGFGAFLACTGEDPDLAASPPDAGSAETAASDGASPGDGGAGDAVADAAPPLMTCQLEFASPLKVRELDPGMALHEDLFLFPATQDRVRLIMQVQGQDAYDVLTFRTKQGELPEIVPLAMGKGKVLSIAPITSQNGGHAAFVAEEPADAGAGGRLLVFPIPANSGSNLGTSPTPLHVADVPNASASVGRLIELIGGTYLYVVAYEDAGSWKMACGRGPGGGAGTGPNTFATFTDRPGFDNDLLLKGGGKVLHIHGGSIGTGAVQTTAYHLPDTCVLPGASVPQTTLAFAGNPRNPMPVARTTTATDPGKYALFLGDPDFAGSPPSVTAWGGLVSPSQFAQNGTLTIAAPAFTQGPKIGPDEVPFGERGSSISFAESVALIGSGLSSGQPDGGGLNFMVIDVDGHVRAKHAGPGKGFLGDRLPNMGRLALTVAQDLGGIVTFALAWIEHVPEADGGAHDAVFLNRLNCVSQ